MKHLIFKNKNLLVFFISTLLTSLLLAGCGSTSASGRDSAGNTASVDETGNIGEEQLAILDEENTASENNSQTMRIGVGIGLSGPVFNATLYETNTSEYLVSQIRGDTMLLPYSYDQNGVMKYYDMPSKAPEDEEAVEAVSAGDILLDGGDRLIVFYQDATLSGSYTRVGYIEDPAGFAEAVGDGDLQFFIYREAVIE